MQSKKKRLFLYVFLLFFLVACKRGTENIELGEIVIDTEYTMEIETLITEAEIKTIKEGDVGSITNPLRLDVPLEYYGDCSVNPSEYIHLSVLFTNMQNLGTDDSQTDLFTIFDKVNNPIPLTYSVGSVEIEIELHHYGGTAIGIYPLVSARADYEASVLGPLAKEHLRTMEKHFYLRPESKVQTNLIFLYSPEYSDKLFIDLGSKQGLWIKLPDFMKEGVINE